MRLSVLRAVGVGLAALISRAMSSLAPRHPRRWVFGDRGGRYVDNAMYLFEHVVTHRNDIRATWLTHDRELVRRLRACGRPAHLRWSPRGVLAALRAGVNVYVADPSDTNFAMTGGAFHVNLYHGLPLKQIEFAITTGPSNRVYHPERFVDWLRSRILYAPKWSKHDVLVAPSAWAEAQFRRAYSGRIGSVVRALPPRTTALVRNDAAKPPPLDRERELIDHLRQAGTDVLLYLPTWRRGGGFDAGRALPQLDRLEEVLAAHRTTLAIKAHPYDDVDIPESQHIVVIDRELDVTALLSCAAALITDYSSAMFDVAVIGLPVIFVPYDLDDYFRSESASFTLDPEQLVGPRAVRTADDLLRVIESGAWRSWTLDDDLVGRLWDRSLLESALRGDDDLVDTILQRVGA